MLFHAVIVLLLVTCIADVSNAIVVDKCDPPKLMPFFNSSRFSGVWYVVQTSKDDMLAKNRCIKTTNEVKSATVIDTFFETTSVCKCSANVTVTPSSDTGSPVLFVDDGTHPEDGYNYVIVFVIDTDYNDYLICTVCNTDNPAACDVGPCEMENRVIVMSKLKELPEATLANVKTILSNASVSDELQLLQTIGQNDCD